MLEPKCFVALWIDINLVAYLILQTVQ